MSEATKRFFDARAEDYYTTNYERPRTRHAHNLVLRRDACLELLPPGDAPVLDLGCGPGAMSVPLASLGREVLSVDLAPQMVRDTANRISAIGRQPHAAVANVTALPFAERSFGVVVTTGVLEYIECIDKALAEIARVLRPGGSVIATMSLPRRLERFAEHTLVRLRGQQVARQFIYDRGAFDELVSAAGLQIDARRSCAFSPFPLDVFWPGGVRWLDKRYGAALNTSEFACDHAKTYIVRAHRV
jgi:ubiquinone/menaquinone biosynthesis C-methylase UbiE